MEDMVMEVENDERDCMSEEVKWESFVPRMVLRVLLVEADDSTRQIIGALLRKYNCKVAAISDGLKAWEILKQRHNNIDLILTELDLPSISGYALLTLIMEHDGCKNIPVIMMSSQDSISTVLKCILKGAADFLIKPIRKNELKNLWRHVWRRHDNNAGQNLQNLTSGHHKTEATFENGPATNHSGGNVSSSQKSSSFSEKGFDAQGLSHKKQTEFSHKEGEHQSRNVKLEERLPLPTSATEGKKDELGSCVQPSTVVNISTALRVEEDGSCTGIAIEDGSDGAENQTHRANMVEHQLPERSNEAVDLIGQINIQRITAGKASFNGEFNGQNFTPELELSLKRPLGSKTKEIHERHILNHSSASAFSWYSSNKRPRTTFPSLDGELPKVNSVPDPSPWLTPFSGGRNKPEQDMLVPQSVHCDLVSPCHQIGLAPLSGLAYDGGAWASYGSAFQPMFSPHAGQEARSPNSAHQKEESSFLTSPSLHCDPGTHSSTQGCGQPEHELIARESVELHGCSSSYVMDPSGSSTQCNDFGSQQHQINAHGSASEITDVNAPTPGMKGLNFVEETESCKPVVHDHLRKTMGLHSAEREAALAKFRQKRKGRCYEKKVRYQSRKKLAEQRPRVKGQFVRQVPNDEVLVDNKP